MNFIRSTSILLLFCGFFAHATTLEKSTTPKNTFIALCYHDISSGFAGDAYSVHKKDFIDQLDYLKANYNVVSLQDILDASKGKKILPPKAVLITVDDGLASFYENVYPLLKSYKFKSVFSIVGKWIDDGSAPNYGFKDSNPKMATWKQIKEMQDSGWVDIASHTYDLHQGQLINPQGNQAAMASFFKYDPATKSYQSEEDFINYVRADLKKNNELIKKNLGKDNSIVVWPYGAFNSLSSKAAIQAGLPIQMTLRAGPNNARNISYIGRGLVLTEMTIQQFAKALDQAFVDNTPLRMIRVDIDGLWKNTEAETEIELGDLLDQSLALGANGVLVQAISDNGEAYFPTSHLKVRGDYLNRTIHALKYRARVDYAYVRLPQSFLKNTATATAAIRDLAKFTDIDGIFFEISSKESLKTLPFKAFMASGRSIRPLLQFGLIGQSPTKTGLFDYEIMTTPQLEKEKLATSSSKTPKVIVALSHDYKQQVPHLLSQGYTNLLYDVNFKGFVPDTDFKNLFSVRQIVSKQNKGDSK
ncbi:MAG: poly-beta-1,6-N-acetyl-D-glucosamine N-deacetylase PgaB [Bacillota bacterium]